MNKKYFILIIVITIVFVTMVISWSPKSYAPYGYGEWTPTITNSTNVSGSTPHSCNWIRIGNKITVSGVVDVTTTTAASNSIAGVSLPVSSNLTTIYDASGVISATDGWLSGDATNDRLTFTFTSNISGSQTIAFSGIYYIK